MIEDNVLDNPSREGFFVSKIYGCIQNIHLSIQNNLHSKNFCIYSIVYFVYIHETKSYTKRTARRAEGEGVPLSMRKSHHPSSPDHPRIRLSSFHLCTPWANHGEMMALSRLSRSDTSISYPRERKLCGSSGSSRWSGCLRDSHLCRWEHRDYHPSFYSNSQ